MRERIKQALNHIEANIDRAEVRRSIWADGREKYEIWLSKSEKGAKNHRGFN